MIVPQYWAEGRLQHRARGKQVTVRRFGWSDDSQEDAQAHADARVREAFDRVLAGEKLPRRDYKQPYNGAEGLPIREEIISRHGDSIISAIRTGRFASTRRMHCSSTSTCMIPGRRQS